MNVPEKHVRHSGTLRYSKRGTGKRLFLSQKIEAIKFHEKFVLNHEKNNRRSPLTATAATTRFIRSTFNKPTYEKKGTRNLIKNAAKILAMKNTRTDRKAMAFTRQGKFPDMEVKLSRWIMNFNHKNHFKDTPACLRQ